MDDATSRLSSDVNPEQSDPVLHSVAHSGAMLVSVALLLSLWGQWPVFLGVLATTLVLMVGNVGVTGLLTPRIAPPVAEAVRLLLNTLGFVVNGHLTAWAPLVWFFLPFNLLWFSGMDRWVRVRLGIFLVTGTTFALWDGANPWLVLTFAVVGTFGYVLTERRIWLLRQMLRQVIDQREQLQRAHTQLQQIQRLAFAQEKLSSLGVMAAGIAHEINNPMSFITSNVNSLYRELQRQSSLPEPFKEYVDDVLPATLHGIRRVNAIVDDLRRFSRGAPESSTEYELNTEVQAALRIAHHQLGHCHVETDLGEVGTITGRPQEIVKVLVNLLVNAGQATAAGGTVRVSTRREGEWVRVEVRDTGPGLSTEAMRNLFQPFFTTKPTGTGMGLGLAVVHGIITAHGGRIEVNRQPGQGACFTVHLPRVPTPAPAPLPATEAVRD